ncbi:MAG: phosphoribosylformylglycinamidine synthase subunit PurS [Deltaproteobacteria bacterium]|nr:phosphoribosylformylglycinamidine synthase subunit PurS [Deltaproteobacteria bacterium]
MKAKVYVTLKNGVLDPQGRAVAHALESLGFDSVQDVRVGRFFEIQTEKPVEKKALESMAEKLLANPVIENFRVEME